MADQVLQNIFFALWPDSNTRSALCRLQNSWPEGTGRMHHPDDLHMTVVFLGRVLEEQMSCVHQAAAKVRPKPFIMEITKSDYWKRPKILLCGPDYAPEPLVELVIDLQQQLKSCGFEPEKRTYKPHITMARKARPAVEQQLEERIVWKPGEFVLAGSHSGPKPPRYRILKRWKIPT